MEIPTGTKTLFVQSPGRTGVLVYPVKRGHRQKTIRFRDGKEAIAWCEEHGAILIYFPAERVSGN